MLTQPFDFNPIRVDRITNSGTNYSLNAGEYGIVRPFHPFFQIDGYYPFRVTEISGSSPNVSGPSTYICFNEIVPAGAWIDAYVRQAGQLNFSVTAEIDLICDPVPVDQYDYSGATPPVPYYLEQLSFSDTGLGENDVATTLQRFNPSMTNARIEGRAITSSGTADSRWWHLYIYRAINGGEYFTLKQGEIVIGKGYTVDVFKVAS